MLVDDQKTAINRDIDMNNGLVNSVGEGEDGMNWEIRINIYTPFFDTMNIIDS